MGLLHENACLCMCVFLNQTLCLVKLVRDWGCGALTFIIVFVLFGFFLFQEERVLNQRVRAHIEFVAILIDFDAYTSITGIHVVLAG